MRTIWLALAVVGCGGGGQGGHTTTVLFEGSIWGEQLAVADGEVFFTTYGGDPAAEHAVRAVSTTTRDMRVVWAGGPHELFSSGLVPHGDRVVWTGEADGIPAALLDAPIAGGDRRVLAQLTNFAWYAGVAADDQQLYLPGTMGSVNGIFTVPFTGGSPTLLEEISGDPQWITLHGRTLYYTTQAGSSTLHARELDTGSSTTLATLDISSGRAFGVTDDAIYLPGSQLQRLGLDGTLLGTIDTGDPVSTVRTFDNDVYYIARTTLGRLVDSTADVLVDGLHIHEGGVLAYDGNAIYVTGLGPNAGPGQVLQVDLDP